MIPVPHGGRRARTERPRPPCFIARGGVAADAVESVEREGQRTLLRLTDDLRVPVGRSYRPDLKGLRLAVNSCRRVALGLVTTWLERLRAGKF